MPSYNGYVILPPSMSKTMTMDQPRERPSLRTARSATLDELIKREERDHPAFDVGVEAVAERRRFLRRLASLRVEADINQAEMARRMGTLQPAVARLESGDIDPKLSTIQRYLGALGRILEV